MITNYVFKEAERSGGNWVASYRTQQRIDKMDSRLKRPNYEKRIRWDIDKEA